MVADLAPSGSQRDWGVVQFKTLKNRDGDRQLFYERIGSQLPMIAKLIQHKNLGEFHVKVTGKSRALSLSKIDPPVLAKIDPPLSAC